MSIFFCFNPNLYFSMFLFLNNCIICILMNNQKDIEKYWKEIEKEVNILKETSLTNAQVLDQQTDTITTVNTNSEVIEHNVKLSKWLLHMINSTFSKVYQTIHREPKTLVKGKIKTKNKNIIKSTLKSNHQNRDNIINTLNDIKTIHVAIGEELDNQNDYLENINDKNDNIVNTLNNNNRLAKKILRDL
jgi:hypothetical protein